MSVTPRLRRFDPRDAPAVASLFEASRAAAMPWLVAVHGHDETVAFFAHVVPVRREVWLAEDAAGALLGFIAFGGGEVEHLYVAPAARGAGVGSALLALATARGEPLELWTFERNATARAFYAARGFREVERTDGSGNEEREPDVRMRWEP
ncbi:MAG: GNAT family N-acetyltransferase [Anaeromyxobacteraceae bacterium]